jgi:hypothetical protein
VDAPIIWVSLDIVVPKPVERGEGEEVRGSKSDMDCEGVGDGLNAAIVITTVMDSPVSRVC